MMNRTALWRRWNSPGGGFLLGAVRAALRFAPRPGHRFRTHLACLVLGLAGVGLMQSGCSQGDVGVPDGGNPGEATGGIRSTEASEAQNRRIGTPEVLKPHPSDGEGSVRILPDDPVVCGSRGSWTVEWTAGPSGLDPGDAVVLQVSPFWGWSPPRTYPLGAPGYTTVSASANVTLDLVTGEVPSTVIARVADGRLAPGDTLRFVYGDSASGGAASLARADMYAEEFEELLIKTDGNGDGFFVPVPDQPTLRILPARPIRLAVAAPAHVRPGESFRVAIHALDARDNLAPLPEGPVRLLLHPLRERAEHEPGPDRPATLTVIERSDGFFGSVVVMEPGLYRLDASLADPPLFGANDLLLVDERDTFAGILWGDLHAHSALSDGTGAPADLYRYARDVVGLDLCVVTDHDAHGLAPLAGAPWEVIRAAARAFHEPGRFVTLLGYEWTSWTWGHRNVYYPGDEGEVFSFLDEESDTPEELWDRIAEFGGVTIAHHPGGGPVPVDWSIPSPEGRETVVEICSVHGSSEAPGVERGIYNQVRGASVRDALNAGHQLGVLASGDTHDGHPGRRTVGAATNGLAALRGAGHTRDGVMRALRERRVYGTSGPRILLATDWGGRRPGTRLSTAPSEPIIVRVVAPQPVEVVELIGPNGVVDASWGGGRRCEHRLDATIGAAASLWRYVRVVLADGEVAWESPWWIGETK